MAKTFQKIINFIFRVDSAKAETSKGMFVIHNPLNISADTSLESIINSIIDLLITIGIPLAGLMYLWAGFQFLTAAGDSRKVSLAKKTILYTTIGVAILLSAKGIIIVVEDLLTP